ncbi:MAG TPA: hypothetical protein VHY59_11685, partial [Chthoniobacterales bacterium]|nr:hypothetical protein [Chthoniobacterales bacterium]
GGLYDLLRSLEAAKVGNVEVRPVAPMLALPPPEKKQRTKRKQPVRGKVLAAMPLKEMRTTQQLIEETGSNPKSVHSVLFYLAKNGIVKHTGFGEYTRVKDGDQ